MVVVSQLWLVKKFSKNSPAGEFHQSWFAHISPLNVTFEYAFIKKS